MIVKKVKYKKPRWEIVERKGLGHPDHIADAFAEEFSRALCKAYMKEFGVILHHNVDKLDLVGGQAVPKFGGGVFKKRIIAFYSGRATERVGNVKFDLKNLAIKSAQEYLKKNFRFLKKEHFKFIIETKPGAGNLTDIYKRKKGEIGANDTSVGIGYWPLSKTEHVTLDAENYLNSKRFKKRHPYTGEDIKVMTVRNGDKTKMTIACAFIDKYFNDVNGYVNKKEEVRKELMEKYGFDIDINTADDLKRGINGCYLTLTGSSLETGDDGAVGRGNRVNGLITFNRLMSLEAVAGKNPVNHIGKLYNVAAFEACKKIVGLGARHCQLQLVSSIGKPLTEPQIAVCEYEGKLSEQKIKNVVHEELSNIKKLGKRIVSGKVRLF